MTKYRFGVIFNLDRYLKFNDPTGMFTEVDQKRLLQEIVRFLTEDARSPKEGRAILNEIEYLVGVLHHQEIIDDYIIELDEPYVKIQGVLFAICESIVGMFEDTHFYEYLRETKEIPKVIPVSRSNFAIVVTHPIRNHGQSDLYRPAEKKLHRLRRRD
jgi:hypothetical protein